MAKKKLKAVITVADGAGGMVPVQDRRFENSDWPISLQVSHEDSEAWLRYLSTVCQGRGWSFSSLQQLERQENSGSISITTPEGPGLTVVWERKRDGPIKVRARSAGTPEIPLAEMQALFQEVDTRCRSRTTERFYCRGQLEYNGLPWRGELWLDDTLRLGPPSQQYETALLGPRIILVDAYVDAIDQHESHRVFEQHIRELSAFLSVVLEKSIRAPNQGQAWTWTISGQGTPVSEPRTLGYFELQNPTTMPARGTCLAVPLRNLSRPDFSLRGLRPADTEQSVPEDITDLFKKFRELTPDKRRQFLQAAAKWQEALMYSRERSTLSFALMVVACEALKPPEREFNEHSIYEVVEALLGRPTAARLRENWFRAQHVRSVHLHLGEFHGSEFLLEMMLSSFHDPTFDQARRELALITTAAIIEWLRREGAFVLPISKRPKTVRRWVKERFYWFLIGTLILGLIGGWVARLLWHS